MTQESLALRDDWTLAEADAALPEVRRLLAAARGHASVLRDLQAHLNDLRFVHGDQVLSPAGSGHAEFAQRLAQFQQERERYLAALRAFEEVGVEVKDVEAGLADFRGQVAGRPAYLCWRDGEASVTHWHELEAGFAGRKRLPDAALRRG